jgi:hypothetical protein
MRSGCLFVRVLAILCTTLLCPCLRNECNSGISQFFFTTMIKGKRLSTTWSVFEADTMPIGVWTSDRYKHRFGFILAGALTATTGYKIRLEQRGKSRDYKFGAVFLVLGGAYIVTRTCLGVLQNDLSGPWKRTFGASDPSHGKLCQTTVCVQR